MNKPKLVFFQFRYDKHLPEFLITHKLEHVKCLSEFFDVTVIHEDCDYLQICETYQPELTLFESGVNHETCQRLKIKNIHACPEIPKLGLHHADSFCNARAGFLSDMDHWGIDTFFAISTTAAEHTPEIADNLFIWPVFVDADIFRDYGVWKSIPVLFTGNKNAFYPWRKKIIKVVSEHYPSLICPHPGYSPGSTLAHIMVGETYARTINSSWFVPACGSVAKEAVRKHFEVPACKACLITEKSPALEAAGFADMENCIFSDEQNILDKLAWLFKNLDELNAIIEAGYNLVHSRHTLRSRDQIFQWFNLNKILKENQRIVQLNPFDSPILVQKESGIRSSHIVSNGLHLELLHQGDEKLWKGKYEEAEAHYLECLNFMRWMPEPKLKLALCNLYNGNAPIAFSLIVEPIEFILTKYKAIDPDPVEWAYFIVCFLCLGKLDAAIKRANQFPWLDHPELNRVRWVTNVLKKNDIGAPLQNNYSLKRRSSMHQLPNRSFMEWIEQLYLMLNACEQYAMTETLKNYLASKSRGTHEKLEIVPVKTGMPVTQEERDIDVEWTRKDDFFKKRLVYKRLRSTLSRCLAGLFQQFEAKYGYILPYYLRTIKDDECFEVIKELAHEKKIRTALVIGAVSGKDTMETFLAGIQENESKPSVFCITFSRGILGGLQKLFANTCSIKWHRLSLSSRETLREKLENIVKKIMEDNQINVFDAVLVDSSALKHQTELSGLFKKELHEARIVMLCGINSFYCYTVQKELRQNSSHALVAHNPDLQDGYFIFKKCLNNAELTNSDVDI